MVAQALDVRGHRDADRIRTVGLDGWRAELSTQDPSDGHIKLGTVWLTDAGTLSSSWYNILAGDQVVGRSDRFGAERYYHSDLLGSTRAVVDPAGTITESYDYDPMGAYMQGRMLLGETDEQFAGGEYDWHQYYFGARSYRTAYGRWNAVDARRTRFRAGTRIITCWGTR